MVKRYSQLYLEARRAFMDMEEEQTASLLARSLLCYVSITVLNVLTVRRVLEDPPAIVKNMLRGFLAAVIMGIFTFGAWYGLKYVGISSNLILCAAPIMVGVVLYVVCAIKLRAITREDCLLLPKGEKIANLLHL